MSFEDTASRFSQQQELTEINFTIPNQIFFAAENVSYLKRLHAGYYNTDMSL